MRHLKVVIALIERQGRFLISQRHTADSFGGKWEFPGGKLLQGERLETGLIREIREELGIRIRVLRQEMVISHPYPQGTVRFYCYLCRVISGKPAALASQAWCWAHPSELKKFSFPPASGPVLALLQEGGVC